MSLKVDRYDPDPLRLDQPYEPPLIYRPAPLPADTLKRCEDVERYSLEITGIAPTRVQQSILGSIPALPPPLVFPTDESLDFEAMKCMETARDHQAHAFKLVFDEVGHQRKANKNLHQDLDAVKDKVEKKQKMADIASLIKKIAGFISGLLGIGSIGATIATVGLGAPLMILPAVSGLFSAISSAVQEIFQMELDKQTGIMREHKEHISLNHKKIEDLTTTSQLAVQQAHDLWKIAMSLHQSRNIHFF